MNISRLTLASVISTKITIVYVVVITILAEYFPALKTLLKSLTGHHWTTKSLSSLVLYFALLLFLYALVSPPTDAKLQKAIKYLSIVAICGALILFLFFFWHFFFI